MNKYERIKTFFFGVMTTLSLLVLLSATSNKSILKVKELHIVDENSKTRIKMSIQNSMARLCFYDTLNNERIKLEQRSKDNTEFRMSASHNILISNSDHAGSISLYPQDKKSIDINSTAHKHFGGSQIELYNKQSEKIWGIDSTDY